MSKASTFNILDHRDKLTIIKETASELICECPGCGGHSLKIAKSGSKAGAYKCWSNECKEKDIRDAIAPLPSRQARQIPKKPAVKKPQAKPAAIPTGLRLAQLPAPATDSPQPQRDFSRQLGEILKTTYVYSLTPVGQLSRWVVRTDWFDPSKPKGRDKKFCQWHQGAEGQPVPKKGDQPWDAYRIDEAIAAVQREAAPGLAVALVIGEGEKVVEALRKIGIASITLQGSSWGEADLKRLTDTLNAECPGVTVVMVRDSDAAGEKKAAKVQAVCDAAVIPCLIIDPLAILPDLPEGEGGDVADILEAMDAPEFIRRLEEEIHRAASARQQSESADDSEPLDIPDGFDPDSEFVQKVRRDLYGDKPWICVDGILHYWTGNHYKASLDVVEAQRLWRYCNAYAVADDKGKIRYPYAAPIWVKKALEWVKQAYGVDPALVDPPGLNCTNGVLQISWDGSQPIWKLVSHDPAMYYTYEPVVTYNPDADPSNCERLLAVLDAPEQEIFLRTIAASLDLATVRRHKGRLVRGILFKGHGSNGKDTLREAVAAMYGYRGMTGATLTDFASYDEGRKFPLSRLRRSRVNWASENTNTSKLDKIQSLKAFITGDPISIEGKGKDEYEFTPLGVVLFNVNDTPHLQASQEAILSRYAVLTCSKTFKIGADPSKGELEADPRFKYDPDFLRSEVLPAFLNRVLDALTQLMAEGIDYRCTEQALEDIQAENSHLFQFGQETGLGYDPNGSVSAGEIWERLEAWYIDNGTLTYEESGNGKKKSLWVDQARRGDANVKGANQVIPRFQNLFPKAKRVTVGKGKMTLQGISFSQSKSDAGQLRGSCGAVAGQLVSQQPLLDKGRGAVTPVFQLAENFKNILDNLSEDERRQMLELLGVEKLTRLPRDPDAPRDTALPIAPQLPRNCPATAPQQQEPNSATTDRWENFRWESGKRVWLEGQQWRIVMVSHYGNKDVSLKPVDADLTHPARYIPMNELMANGQPVT